MMGRVFKRHRVLDGSFITVMYLAIMLTMKPQTPAVFLLVVVSLNLVVLRFRFKNLYKGFFIDMGLFFALSLVYEDAHYLSLLPFYLAIKEGRFKEALVLVPLVLIARTFDGEFLMLWLLALLFGFILHSWQKEKKAHLNTIDTQRKTILEIQDERARLLDSQSEISRIASYSERERIAKALHDNLGHEITAGLLSLKAYQKLEERKKSDPELLKRAIHRIDNAASELKKTVHNTKPVEAFGQEVFDHEIKRFSLPVEYHKSGDPGLIQAHHWQVLNAVLKESLTNVLKHSDATEVHVTLEVTAQVIRFMVENDRPRPAEKTGKSYGLTFMRQRIEALGGTLSFQHGLTYKVIAILPFEEVDHEDSARG
ncbi:MAG: sensor histidine kinase [Bacillota bacterium]